MLLAVPEMTDVFMSISVLYIKEPVVNLPISYVTLPTTTVYNRFPQ